MLQARISAQRKRELALREAALRLQREDTRGASARPPSMRPASARPPSLPTAQQLIQQRFEAQAAQWLREEQGQSSPAPPEPPPSPALSATAKALRRGLTGDLESLLSASLRPSRPAAAPAQADDDMEFHLEAGPSTAAPELDGLWDDAEGDAMGNDDEARARRARLRLLGMQNMGQIPQREAPPEPVSPAPPPAARPAEMSGNSAARPSGLSGGQPAVKPSGMTGPNSAVKPSGLSGANSAVRPKPSEADLKLGEEITARFERLKTDDLFQRLGLSRGAAGDLAKNAFIQLAKRFHPDMLPPSLGHLASQSQALFNGLREAHDLLTNDKTRMEYMAQLARPRSTGAPVAQAPLSPEQSLEIRKLRVMAETSLRKKAFAEAATHYAKAYGMSGDANDIASQAWSIYMDPARKNDLLVVQDLLRKAFAVAPGSDKAHYVTGVIARAQNRMDDAERSFQAAIKSNPQHTDAAMELRLLARRKEKAATEPPEPPKKKGFFGL
jgi:hypothetical protein